MTVAVIGPPAAGKSRIGRIVAKRLGVPFVDTDSRVVRDHGPVARIFAEHGEARFRELERATVAAALAEDAVVALGGGAVLDAGTRALLGGADVVLLTITERAAAQRIAGGKRPLITGIDSWIALAAERAELYASLAHTTVDSSTRPATVIADEIAGWARARRSEREGAA